MYVHIYDLLTIATRYPSFLHLGNQFVSCGMDWSICHFDAFSHTKNFIHNFLRVPEKEAKSRFQGVLCGTTGSVRGAGPRKTAVPACNQSIPTTRQPLAPRCHKQMPRALGKRTPKPGVSRVPSAAPTPGPPPTLRSALPQTPSECRQGHSFPRFPPRPPQRHRSPAAPLAHRHPRKTWLAQAMEKETSCWSCRRRLPLSASAAASPGVEGTRSPALRSRNSRRWRQCLSVSPSQRSVSAQAATRGFWLRYSATSCAMLGLRDEESASAPSRGRPSGGARPCQRGLHRRASRDRPSSSPNPKTTEHGADEPPTSAGRRPAPFYHLAAAARSRVLPAPARSPGVLCGDAEPPATRRQGEPGRGGAEATEGWRPPANLRGRAAPGAAGARRSGGAL